MKYAEAHLQVYIFLINGFCTEQHYSMLWTICEYLTIGLHGVQQEFVFMLNIRKIPFLPMCKVANWNVVISMDT